jgi:hypothetical protein
MANALSRRLEAFNFTPTFNPNFNELERVARITARHLGGGEAEVTPEDVDTLFDRFKSEWASHGKLERLSRRTLKWFPHLLFYPPQAPGQWLAHDEALKIALRHYLDNPRNTRALTSLCHAFLRSFPVDSTAFNPYAALCSTALADSTRVRSKTMREASVRFRLFSLDGPTEVAKFWLEYNDNITSLKEMPELSVLRTPDSRFNHHLALALLSRLRVSLKEGKQHSPAFLKGKLALVPGAVTTGTTTLDPDLRKPLAEALLQPFVKIEPPEGHKKWARPLVLGHLGDPRHQPVPWSDVNKGALEVMKRWLVEDTLDQFFNILDKTAMDRHWKDRKAFWLGYLEKSAIGNAVVVLGTDATVLAEQMFDDESGYFGELAGGERSQSVLLMEFGPSLVVAEWSHRGACHFWDDPEVAPELGAYRYAAADMRTGSVSRVVHQPQHNPSVWQEKIARTINYHTNIRHPSLPNR